MDEMKQEDRTAPISKQEVLESLDNTLRSRVNLLDRLINELNRRRDAYSGIISSIFYVIDAGDVYMITELQERITKLITAYPMRYGGKMFLSKVQARVVSERPLFVQKIFENILSDELGWSYNFPDDNAILGLKILAVKSIKNAENQRGGTPSKIDQKEIDNLCLKAIHCCDSSIKIDTFSFIFDSRSTTKLLTERDFSLFIVLFQSALDLQEPFLRQTFLAVTNRVLKRLKKSHEFVMRDKKLYKSEEKQSITASYMKFLSWLIGYCFDNTYCNAYFGSFIITVSTLKLVIQHITYNDQDLNIKPLLDQRRCYDSLIACLGDSFEDNKSLALETLLLLPKNDYLLSEEKLASFEKIAYDMANSVNPAHSLTCQYMFKLVINLKLQEETCKLSKNQLILSHLCNLVHSVEQCLESRKNGTTLIESLKLHPNYPKLSCIKVLLDQVDSSILDQNYDQWCIIIKKIAHCSIASCQDISVIVCNPNPESIGHLPMDLKPVDTLNSSPDNNTEAENDNIVTSQMVLISGWKTIKESSLIFGILCSKFWWPETPTKPDKCPGRKFKPILSNDVILSILDFFNYYMKRLRHRGAFEQAYEGFTRVTNHLKYDKNMSELVLDSLNDSLNEFQTDNLDEDKAELLRASITRRSGGLPFSIQAKLNLEEDPLVIKSVMNCLFDVIKSSNSDSYKRIHCMNILGALIKQHSQGEKVMPYVGESFSVAFEAFRSDSYPIRNCANMLLKATVDRTFGVNRLRTDIHRKNQLSFERFFSNCPSLHGEMLTIFEDTYNQPTCFAAIHAVFIVLFRLCPSLNPSDTFSPEMTIYPFIEKTRNILFNCSDPYLRSIAAELTVRLESFFYDETILEKTHLVIRDNQERIYSNHSSLHGLIVYYKFYIEYHAPNLDESVMNDIMNLSNQFKSSAGSISKDNPLYRNYNETVQIALLDLIESHAINLPHLKQLISPIHNLPTLMESHIESLPCDKIIYSHMYLSVLVLHHDKSWNLHDAVKAIEKCLRDDRFSLNLRGAITKLFRQVMSQSDCFVDRILKKFDLDLDAALITPHDRLEHNIENDRKRDVIAKFCDMNELVFKIRRCINTSIFKLYKYKEFQIDLSLNKFTSRKNNTIFGLELLAFALKNWDILKLDETLLWSERWENSVQKLDHVTKMISELPDCDIKCLIILCAGRHMIRIFSELQLITTEIKDEDYRYTSILRFTEILDQLADGDSSITIRQSCVEVLRMSILSALELNRLPKSFLINLFSALIKLSQDEISDIRGSVGMIISSFKSLEPLGGDVVKYEELEVGSRLDRLIKILTTKVFQENSIKDICSCFDLLIRIIFNHSKNYSHNLTDETERLFDKTKLNTFADFVTIIESTLAGLKQFFKRSKAQRVNKEMIDIKLLKFSDEVINEFKLVDAPKPSDKGDYSWRLSKITKELVDLKMSSCPTQVTNIELLGSFIQNTIESLSYFASGYSNVLLDTEYIYHELSLFKRISFLIFLVRYTDHKLEINESLAIIKQKLEEITTTSCCTTLLNKCLRIFD